MCVVDREKERENFVFIPPSVKVSPDGMDSLVALSQGDMRRSLNILQSTSMAHDEVTEETVYLCTGQPLPSDIAQIVEWMLNVDFSTAYSSKYE